MKIQDFEVKLKEIDSSLKIIPHPSNEDMAGVYYSSIFICGVPSNEIFEEIRPEYKSKLGFRHRTTEETIAKVNQFLYRLKNEEGFADLFKE